MIEFHEFSAVFPLLEGAELRELADDIGANGLREPIWLYEGNVLDGRNRLRACEMVGVEPFFRTFTGGREEALALVVSENLHRRHLTQEGKESAMLALRQRGWSYRRIAAEVGVAVGTVHAHVTAGVQNRTPAAKDSPEGCPTGLFANSLAWLREHENHRHGNWGASGMVYWAVDALRLMASLEEVYRGLEV